MSGERDPRYAVSIPRQRPTTDPALAEWADGVVRALDELQGAIAQGGVRTRIPVVRTPVFGSESRTVPDMAGEVLIRDGTLNLFVHFGASGWRVFIPRGKVRNAFTTLFAKLEDQGVTLPTAARDDILAALD